MSGVQVPPAPNSWARMDAKRNRCSPTPVEESSARHSLTML